LVHKRVMGGDGSFKWTEQRRKCEGRGVIQCRKKKEWHRGGADKDEKFKVRRMKRHSTSSQE